MFPDFDLLNSHAPDLVFQMRPRWHKTEHRASWSGVAFVRVSIGEYCLVDTLTDGDTRGSFQWVHSVWRHWPELKAICHHEFGEDDWGITVVNNTTFEEFVDLLQRNRIPALAE